MKKEVAEDRRLARVTQICLALPESTKERHGSHASFRVRKTTITATASSRSIARC
jgi:hypothetical protein